MDNWIIGELIENIYSINYYYNNRRMHTSLKTTPVNFRNRFKKPLHYLIKKLGTLQNSNRNMIRKIIKTLFVFTFILGVVGFSLIVLLVFIGSDELDKARLFGGKKSFHVPTKGGSMYPSFAWCNNKNEEGVDDCASLANEDSRLIVPVLLNFDKDFKLERGMIVSIKIEQEGLIKRVIGLPNETIRLDGGYVYINNNKIDEPYIWKNGSTSNT